MLQNGRMDRLEYSKLIQSLAFKNGKMAFVTGPRQVGKTTLSEQLIKLNKHGEYFNWDDVEFRRKWIKDPKTLVPQTVGEKPLIVLDELHKAPRWKSYLKGLYDMRKNACSILVTGSAKLDVFRKGGDSLLGRYFLFRLHPFSLGELEKTSVGPDEIINKLEDKISPKNKKYKKLLSSGGFPDPYLNGKSDFINAWRRMRTEKLVREDLVDLTRTHEIALIEALVSLIPERVGSLFSIQSIAEDLDVSYPTAKRWIGWLSQLFYLFEIKPYTKRLARSIKKQPKIYLWDWAEIKEEPIKFENLIASHLLKAVHFWTDSGFGKFELFYVRDKEKREVDFLVVREKKPWMLVESKLSDQNVSSSLVKFASILNTEINLQVVGAKNIQEWFHLDNGKKGQVISADSFLTLLP